MAKAKMIKVQATGTDNKVALWEKHADHPNGEAFIYGDGSVHEVAHTAAVKTAIGEGKLTTDIDEDRVPEAPAAPPLRPATEQEEENARPPLETPVEKATARVPQSIRRGTPPGS